VFKGHLSGRAATFSDGYIGVYVCVYLCVRQVKFMRPRLTYLPL